MDPITHALLGAVSAQSLFSRRLGRAAGIVGALAAITPDVDVFFPAAGPMLHMALHRGFTHSLLWVPLGAAVVTAVCAGVSKPLRPQWRWAFLAACVGWFTHGLLDAFTSYGTQWYWPFADTRVAWDWIAIVDPIFTGVLLVGALLAMRRVRARPAIVALLLAAGYLALGAVQHARALRVQAALAAQRGQVIERGRAMPTLGNLLVWRSVYASGGRLHADAIRVGFGAAEVRDGGSVAAAAPTLDDPKLREDVRLFLWFSDGFVAWHEHDQPVLADMRYSLQTEAFAPLWGLRLHPPTAGGYARWISIPRPASGRLLGELWRDIRGAGVGWRGVNDPPADGPSTPVRQP